jgi:catechol 2,3-dioxygenase-like lactoylglutathione lyase family enzyme
MSSTDTSSEAAAASVAPKPGEWKLEVIQVPVSDVDRAKEFYGGLGWREDADFDLGGGVRVVQYTPPGSACSIGFGTGVSTMEPGSQQRLEMAVYDIKAARDELIDHGVNVEEIWHREGTEKVTGPDPEGRSYQSYAGFSDPDGNTWLLQEIKERLPGR